MTGKLNIFQRTMLQWNELHPYNAVHVVRIDAALERERLTNTLNRILEIHGLTGLKLDRQAGTYSYRGGPAGYEVQPITPTGGYHAALTSEIERQLNTPFADDDTFKPFRFFALSDESSFALGLAYFHPVADAESCVFLLKQIVEAYQQRNLPAAADPLELYPRAYDNLFRRPSLLVRKLAALPRFIRDMRSSCRPKFRDSNDQHVGFSLFASSSSDLATLLAAAKSWDVTLNDVFLALLLKAVQPIAADRRRERRRNISLGCIVNARKDLEPAGSRNFGLCLGSFVVTHEVPAGVTLRELAQGIRDRTAVIKRGGFTSGRL